MAVEAPVRLPTAFTVTPTFADALVRAASTTPDATALVLSPHRLTYREMLERVVAATARLAAHGVVRGDRVGVMMPNCVPFVDQIFAITVLGAMCVPINTRAETVELRHAVNHAGLRLVVAAEAVDGEPDLAARLRRPEVAELGAATLVLDEGFEPPTTDDVETFDRARRQGRVRDGAVLLYTSGTTSAPKGCVLSHEAIVRCGIARLVERQTTPDRALWTPCPLFHVGALVPLLGCVATGTTYVTTRRFDASETLRLLEQEGVTMALPLFPAFTDALMDAPDFASTDLSAVRQILTTGPPRGVRRAMAAFAPAKLVSGYGSTEMCGVSASSRLDDTDQQRLEFEGHPLDGIEMRVVDPVSGDVLAPGMSGEIVARGYSLFDAYYRDPEATARAIDAGGWFHTGDIGTMDGAGRIAFLGRYKDMLKVGGENVAALEVESFLGAYPGVRRVEVVGAPDERLGEVVAAFVELEPGAAVDGRDLLAHCEGRIARFKQPRHIVMMSAEEWPMSATKVNKVALRQMIRERVGHDGR
jgi:acyl-CoA synthetase (AMP-forming)/AMP-acid ligase II